MKEFELTMRLRNNLLKRRRVELGMSAREMAAAIGISYQLWLRYEGLNKKPISAKTLTWSRSARRIAEYFGTAPDELWPDVVLKVVAPEVIAEIDSSKVLQLSGYASPHLLPPRPDELYEECEMAELLDRSIDLLTPRQREVVRLRFGIGGEAEQTFGEIGAKLGLSAVRVQQIERKALSRLRGSGPGRSRIPKDLWPEDHSQ